MANGLFSPSPPSVPEDEIEQESDQTQELFRAAGQKQQAFSEQAAGAMESEFGDQGVDVSRAESPFLEARLSMPTDKPVPYRPERKDTEDYSDVELTGNPSAMNIDLGSGDDLYDQIMAEQEAKREEEASSALGRTRGLVNFLFAEEMGVLGMKWDREGFDVGIDNMKEQWADHPVLSTFATAGMVAQLAFPILGMIKKSTKVGKLAQKGLTPGKSLLRTADQTGSFSVSDEIRAMAKANDDFVTSADDVAKAANVDKGSFAVAGEKGLIEKGAEELKEEIAETTLKKTKLGGSKVGREAVEEALEDKATSSGRYFTSDEVAKIATMSDDEVVKTYGKTWQRTLMAENRMQAKFVLKHKMAFRDRSPYGAPTKLDELKYGFMSKFSNTYFDAIHNPSALQISGWNTLFQNSALPQLLAAAPDAKHGASMAKYFAGGLDDVGLATAVKDPDAVNWIKNWSEKMTAMQKQMINDGFLSTDEIAQSAEFMNRHIPALEVGSQGLERASRVGAAEYKAVVERIKNYAPDEKNRILAKYNERMGLKLKSFDQIPEEDLGVYTLVNRAVNPEDAVDRAAGLLDSPTLKPKVKYDTKEKYLAAVERGDVVTNPRDYGMVGLVKDTQLHQSYKFISELMSESVDNPKFTNLVRQNVDNLSKDAKGEWLRLADIERRVPGAGERIRRMMNKSRDGKGLPSLNMDDTPYLSKSFVDEFYDPDGGVIAQIENSTGLLNMLTTLHKTARTALNPGTHVQNIGGNLAFLAMAGYNLLNPFKARERLQDGAMLSKVFRNIANEKISNSKKAAAKIRKALDDGVPLDTDQLIQSEFSAARLFDDEPLTKNFLTVIGKMGKRNRDGTFSYGKYFTKKVDGKHRVFVKGDSGTSIDVSQFFGNKAMRSTIEESAFDNIEGWSALQRMWEKLASREGLETVEGARGTFDAISDFAAKSTAKVAGIAGGYGKAEGKTGLAAKLSFENILHRSSANYLAEDSIPKMMYAIEQAKKGLSVEQTVLEVGRRLPQYQAVGSWVGSARRNALPWITFPAEATRIMKNNLMDYPMRTMAWMQAPGIIQSGLTATGEGPTGEEFLGRPEQGVQPVGEQIPAYAMKYGTVIGDEGVMAPAGGAITGAVVGGSVGLVKKGPMGAALGALMGAAGGAAIGMLGAGMDAGAKPDIENQRAFVLDVLPSSAALWNPATRQQSAEPQNTRQLLDLLPVEPFATIMPVINVLKGEGSFGKEIQTEGTIDSISTGVMALLGHLAPPFVQKYGMKVDGPGGAFVPTMRVDSADILDANGGQQTVSLEADLFGEWEATLSGVLGGAAVGAFKGKSAGSALVGGLLGGVVGKKTNTRRLMQDMGLMGNNYTQVPGNPVYDMAFNTFGGLPKSWEVDPVQGVVNEKFRQKPFIKKRGHYKTQLEDAIRVDNEEQQTHYLKKIARTFTQQYYDPNIAQRKFQEWKKENMETILQSRALRGLSKEEALRLMSASDDFAAKTRSKSARQLVIRLQQELRSRQLNKRSASRSRLQGKLEKYGTIGSTVDPMSFQDPTKFKRFTRGRSGIFR